MVCYNTVKLICISLSYLVAAIWGVQHTPVEGYLVMRENEHLEEGIPTGGVGIVSLYGGGYYGYTANIMPIKWKRNSQPC